MDFAVSNKEDAIHTASISIPSLPVRFVFLEPGTCNSSPSGFCKVQKEFMVLEPGELMLLVASSLCAVSCIEVNQDNQCVLFWALIDCRVDLGIEQHSYFKCIACLINIPTSTKYILIPICCLVICCLGGK